MEGGRWTHLHQPHQHRPLPSVGVSIKPLAHQAVAVLQRSNVPLSYEEAPVYYSVPGNRSVPIWHITNLRACCLLTELAPSLACSPDTRAWLLGLLAMAV